jgi:hypothetical protein
MQFVINLFGLAQEQKRKEEEKFYVIYVKYIILITNKL